MKTLQDFASELSAAFTRDKRHNGKEFVKLKDGSPEWMKEVCRLAHGEMMPDDWRYVMIEKAADYLADSEEPDGCEFADQATEIYNTALLDWVASHLDRAGYVDEAVEELGYPGDLFKSLQYGQYRELEEVYGLVKDALEELVEEQEDE